MVTPPSVSNVSTPPTRLSRIAFAVVWTLANFFLVAKNEYTVTAAAVAVMPRSAKIMSSLIQSVRTCLSASTAEMRPCVRGKLRIKRMIRMVIAIAKPVKMARYRWPKTRTSC